MPRGADPHRIGATAFSRTGLVIATLMAATRVEAIGAASLVAMWELYAVRKMGGAPAELVYIPGGTHRLSEPRHRLISQGGAVDWYRFWLKEEEEDQDSGKREQYERWRGLKAAATWMSN